MYRAYEKYLQNIIKADKIVRKILFLNHKVLYTSPHPATIHTQYPLSKPCTLSSTTSIRRWLIWENILAFFQHYVLQVDELVGNFAHVCVPFTVNCADPQPLASVCYV